MSDSLLDLVEHGCRQSIGLSLEGRPLGMSQLGPGTGPSVVFMGGIHGDEPSGVEALLQWALGAAPLAHGATCFVIPALNPDGLVRMQKNNAGDVDLNRNFAASNFSHEHGAGYFPGAGPASEPETRAFAGFLRDVRASAVVAVHAPFACVNFDGPAVAWATPVAQACGWPVREDLGYPTPGSLGSWLGRDLQIPVLTLELPPGPLSAFASPALAALNAAAAHAPLAPAGW